MVVFFFFFGSSQYIKQHNKSKTSPNVTQFHLEYIDNPTIDGSQLKIIVQDSRTHEKFLLHYKISSDSEKKALETTSFYGLLCEVNGSLKLPQQEKNENAFSYREYLLHKHIFWVIESKDLPLQKCQNKKLSVITYLKKLRFNGVVELQQNFPPEVAALSAALIYGDRGLMSSEWLMNYQSIGISHLLAISGLHVSLLVGMIFFLGIRVGITRELMTNFLLLILPAYAVITGASPSVVRAVLMIFLVLLTIKWKNTLKLLPIDAVSISFLFFLLFNPFVIYDAGFQLSFIVSAAIIISSRRILPRYQDRFLQMLTISIVAQLSAFPFLAYHFFTVNFMAIFANLVFIPLYSYVFLPGVYLLLFIQHIVGIGPAFLMNPFAKIVSFSNELSCELSTFSFGVFTPGRPVPFFLLLYSVIILIIFIIWEYPYSKKRSMVLLLLFFFLFSIQAGWNKLDPIGEVDMIDVGQGDSILIHLPFSKGNYLIDTGGLLPFQMEPWQKQEKFFEPGKDIVVPFLRAKGINQIDKLILTHGDMDHIGGTLSLMKEIKIRQVLLPAVKETSESEAAIIKEAKKRRIQIVHVSAGQQWKVNNSNFIVLSPEKNFKGDRNRGSLTFIATIGGLTWFFGGDLNQEGEEEITRKYPGTIIDVLKVGHHGSRTSSSAIFLKKFKPKIALISVGENNRFGHPHQEVIKNLKKVGARVYRTDTQGEIKYRFFHDKGTFLTYLHKIQ